MTYFFHTEHLTVGYDGKALIRDIEISLEQGSIMTLIGPNGSGKSTILKTITRQLEPVCGTVYLSGRNLDTMHGKELSRQISVVLTERLRTELMSCQDVVATGRYPYTGMLGILSAEDKKQVQQAMELVHVWPLRNRDFSAISDGQRQRVLLARAICQQPQIIILDEPTSFLDVRYELELLNLLRVLTEEQGITVIMSLHELDMAQKISDLVLCVKGEYITHFGPPAEIFRKELIQDLFDLENGSYNPLFGSFEMARPIGEPHLFVIAGGGSGAAEYRLLQKKRIPFATGILHENDIDYQVANDLANAVFAAGSFERIGEKLYHRALQQLLRCDTVINCLRSYGEFNLENKKLYEQAAAAGLRCLESASLL